MGKATNDLRKEHEVILHALDLLDQALQSNTKDDQLKLQFGNELVNFLKTFADKCHHGKEENHLFTALVDKGFPSDSGPIGVMLQEHKQGREYIALMKKSLDSNDLPGFSANAALYRDLLRNHIAKENNILFMLADKALEDDIQDTLYKKFMDHEETILGHGVHEELHSSLQKWEAEFKEK